VQNAFTGQDAAEFCWDSSSLVTTPAGRGDAEPVHGIQLRESLEDEEIERALQVILCHMKTRTLDSEGKRERSADIHYMARESRRRRLL
jgi:hypothetical protein